MKKKRKGKRVTVNIGQPSFFSFFDPLRMPEEDDLKKGKLKVRRMDVEKPPEEDEENGDAEDKEPKDKDQKDDPKKEDEGDDAEPQYMEEDLGDRMDEDYQIAQDFKDELCPLAYEYFMNAVEYGLGEASSEEDDDPEGAEEGGPKPKKKKKKSLEEQQE